MRYLPIAAVFLLGACSSMQISQPPVEVSYNHASGKALTESKSIEPVTIRSKLGGKVSGEEFAGADCLVKNQIYSAKILTPAIVNAPVYGMHSDPLTVTCTYQGQTSTEISDLYSKQDAATRSAAAQGGLLGLVIGEALISGRDKSKHDYAYQSVVVTFKRDEQYASASQEIGDTQE